MRIVVTGRSEGRVTGYELWFSEEDLDTYDLAKFKNDWNKLFHQGGGLYRWDAGPDYFQENLPDLWRRIEEESGAAR